MKISYAITVCNEHFELKRLIKLLIANIRPEDEIVVLSDNATSQVRGVLFEYEDKVNWWQDNLNGDFATFKNHLKSHCTGDYIFQIDADEFPNEQLIKSLPAILSMNPVDLVIVPRINIVNGITDEHIKKWGWRKDEHERINYPDGQTRIIANKPEIKWVNKVHERIVGFKTISHFPNDTNDYCLYHIKSIEKQEKQNLMYAGFTN